MFSAERLSFCQRRVSAAVCSQVWCQGYGNSLSRAQLQMDGIREATSTILAGLWQACACRCNPSTLLASRLKPHCDQNLTGHRPELVSSNDMQQPEGTASLQEASGRSALDRTPLSTPMEIYQQDHRILAGILRHRV